MATRLRPFRYTKRHSVGDIQGLAALVALALVAYSSTANAELVDNGDGLIIDTDLEVMWVQDLNYAATTGYDTDGLLTYRSARSFVDAMNAGEIPNFGFTDWRLPTTLIPDPSCDTAPSKGVGFYCSGSEMGHLYYEELGLVRLQPATPTSHLPFFNLRGTYWSSTEQTPGSSAMVFGLLGGNQFVCHEEKCDLAVLPVRDIRSLASIDIKPFDGRNLIDPASPMLFSVAILSDQDFDALQVDLQSLRLEPGVARPRNYRVYDANRDGVPDLVPLFRARDMWIGCGETEAKVTGETHEGLMFFGLDIVRHSRCPR